MLIAAAWYQIFQNATTNDFTGDSGSKSSIAVVKTAEVVMECQGRYNYYTFAITNTGTPNFRILSIRWWD
jgi:hypothetical protein